MSCKAIGWRQLEIDKVYKIITWKKITGFGDADILYMIDNAGIELVVWATQRIIKDLYNYFAM